MNRVSAKSKDKRRYGNLPRRSDKPARLEVLDNKELIGKKKRVVPGEPSASAFEQESMQDTGLTSRLHSLLKIQADSILAQETALNQSQEVLAFHRVLQHTNGEACERRAVTPTSDIRRQKQWEMTEFSYSLRNAKGLFI